MENEKVAYKGNTYEIGKPYLFGRSLQQSKLIDIVPSSDFPFKFLDFEGLENGSKNIQLVDADPGTVTPVLVKLTDGNAYTFKYHADMEPTVGIYNDVTGRLITNQSIYSVSLCTDIREMVVKK